jgi:hypothetical protein
VLSVNLIQTVARVGRRLAEAGREARAASKSVAGPAAEQITEVVGTAVAEVVRAAVIGAVVAAVRGANSVPRTTVAPPFDPWDDEELPAGEEEVGEGAPHRAAPAARPAWAKATRTMSSALSVAAGAAAAVPGGRVVAAGLGGLAAVAGLAARAAEPAE